MRVGWIRLPQTFIHIRGKGRNEEREVKDLLASCLIVSGATGEVVQGRWDEEYGSVRGEGR